MMQRQNIGWHLLGKWGSMCFIGRIMVADLDLSVIYALLAHSVEHFHGKEEVVGSIPTEGSVI